MVVGAQGNRTVVARLGAGNGGGSIGVVGDRKLTAITLEIEKNSKDQGGKGGFQTTMT